MGPRAAEVVPVAAPARPVCVAAAPLGPKRVVVVAELRSGGNGGNYWLLQLDCRHWLVKPAGRRPKSAPKTTTCVDCGSPTIVGCAGGCGKTADPSARLLGWAFYLGVWRCPDCLRRLLFGSASG